jgi:hypothetical protein
MLFLPEAAAICANEMNDEMSSMHRLTELEVLLFGGTTRVEKKTGTKKMRYRLLRDAVDDMVPVSMKSVFEVNKMIDDELIILIVQQNCIQLNNCDTQLDHSVWKWIYNVVVILQDRTHKLCEDRRGLASIDQKPPIKVGREKKEIKPKTMMPALFAEK